MALVPFALFVEGRDAGAAGALEAAAGGLFLGAVYFGPLLYWIAVSLLWMSPLGVPAYLGVVAVLAAILGGVGWALHRLRRGAGVPLWLALPLAWTAGEWLRGHLPGGLAFPWLGLGTSLTGFPEVVGLAEVAGARGVTFWLALVSGLGAEAVLRWRRGGAGRRWAGWALTAALAPAVLGVWRARMLETRPADRVAVVQPAVEAAERATPQRGLEAARRALDGLAPRLAGAEGVGLVAWPEAALPVAFPDQVDADLRHRLRAHARAVGAPVLLGAYGTSVGAEGAPRRHNSAFLVGADGPRGFVYHKRRLVPLVERVPLIPALPLSRAPRPGGAVSGGLHPGGRAPLGRTAGGAAFGVLICYESAFPSLARDYRRRGADVLVNLTNDAWFGREAWHARTAALWQHPAHLVMRAVETRMGVARAANTGISFFVDPVGRVHGRAPPFRPAVRVAEVRTSDVRTLYVRWGDWVGWGTVAGTLLLVAAAGRPRALDDLNENYYRYGAS